MSSHEDRLDGTTCMLTRKSGRSTVCSWSPEPAKLNSAISRVSRRNLPTAPPSRALTQDVLRHWERAAREQSVMGNQTAGLSRCLTRVKDAMSTQLKNLHSDKGKGKSSERMQQAVDELEYLVTFNWSISQAMARTMQDLSEGVFISVANFTLAHRDSYLEYLHVGVKQDTLTALHTAPIHLQSLFPDQLLSKAEAEVARSEERRSSSQSHRKPGRFHPYASNDKPSHQQDRKPSIQAWKQIREQQGKKSRGKPSTFSQKLAKGSNRVNDNYCVKCATGLKDCACVPGQLGLNPSPVMAKNGDLSSKSETVNLLVNSCVGNAHPVNGLPQKKGINPNYFHNYTEIKYVKDVSCVGHLSSANLVTNVPTVAIDSPVGARLHQFWEKWEALGSSPRGSNSTQRGPHPPLPVQTQFNQITNCQPTKTIPPFGGTVSAGEQKCSRTGSKPKLTGVLQPAFFGTQTQQPVETYLGPEHLEHLAKHKSGSKWRPQRQ